MWKASHDKGSLGTMQSFNCNNQLPNIGDYGIATDSRDSNQYKIEKLKDNKCWMTKGLRIVNKTISSSDSNLPSGTYRISANSTTPYSNMWSGSNSSASWNFVWVDSDPQYGGDYGQLVVSAGQATDSYTGELTKDICPKGWKLPSESNFNNIKSLYGSVAELSKIIANNGGIKYGALQTNSGESTHYWGSTVKYSSGNSPTPGWVIYMQFYQDSIWVSATTKGYPFHAICIAK